MEPSPLSTDEAGSYMATHDEYAEDHPMQTLEQGAFGSSTSRLTNVPGSPGNPEALWGRPVKKRRFYKLVIFKAVISLICLVFALASVSSQRFAWYLGRGNNQLIVLGLLLSIMSICLTSVTPNLFLHLEARFGRSTLHNYDGILRNSLLSSRLGITWRLAIGMTVVLPLVLSIAYKRFAGGSSAVPVIPKKYLGSTSYYGIYGLPGLSRVGKSTGISQFSNATLNFATATAPTEANNQEPELPVSLPQVYGSNLVVLGNDSAAFLDLPRPSYASAVQSMLALGESWDVSAPVAGTVATLDTLKQTDGAKWDVTFMNRCTNELYGHGPGPPPFSSPLDSGEWCPRTEEVSTYGSGTYTHNSILNNWAVQLMGSRDWTGNQHCPQYIGMVPNKDIEWTTSCCTFSESARLYYITRQKCTGTWSITRGSLELLSASCSDDLLPDEAQYPFESKIRFLGVTHIQSPAEFLGQFSDTRVDSGWYGPYFATAIAGMLWSKAVTMNDESSAADGGINRVKYNKTDKEPQYTYSDISFAYSADDTAIYTRPTLRRSPWLYLVIAIQSLLLLVVLAVTASLYSIPLDRGFNLVSVLAGVRPEDLTGLGGAALSGELTGDFRMDLHGSHVGAAAAR